MTHHKKCAASTTGEKSVAYNITGVPGDPIVVENFQPGLETETELRERLGTKTLDEMIDDPNDPIMGNVDPSVIRIDREIAAIKERQDDQSLVIQMILKAIKDSNSDISLKDIDDFFNNLEGERILKASEEAYSAKVAARHARSNYDFKRINTAAKYSVFSQPRAAYELSEDFEADPEKRYYI